MQTALSHPWPRLMRTPVAEAYCGGRVNLERLCTLTGLKPVIRHKSNTTYDLKLVDQAMDKALALGWPEDAAPVTGAAAGKGGRKS